MFRVSTLITSLLSTYMGGGGKIHSNDYFEFNALNNKIAIKRHKPRHTIEPLQVFAFSFNVIFLLDCLSIEDHIGKRVYPVAKVYATRTVP